MTIEKSEKKKRKDRLKLNEPDKLSRQLIHKTQGSENVDDGTSNA